MRVGKPRVPIENQLARQPKGKLSKKQIAERTTVPVQLGDDKIPLPEEIKKDAIAMKKFKWLEKLFHGTNYVTKADVEIIRRICMLYSSEAELWQLFHSSGEDLKFQARIHSQILSTSRHITELEDRLWLNPITRRRGLPPAQRAELQGELSEAGFGDI
jgi:phage terminase small subunit